MLNRVLLNLFVEIQPADRWIEKKRVVLKVNCKLKQRGTQHIEVLIDE